MPVSLPVLDSKVLDVSLFLQCVLLQKLFKTARHI